jgi:hypothetical protein
MRSRGPHDDRPDRDGPARRGDPARARIAARHAQRLYPGALGRLVALELEAYAESEQRFPPGGLSDSVIDELLDRPAPRRGVA